MRVSSRGGYLTVYFATLALLWEKGVSSGVNILLFFLYFATLGNALLWEKYVSCWGGYLTVFGNTWNFPVGNAQIWVEKYVSCRDGYLSLTFSILFVFVQPVLKSKQLRVWKIV